MKRSQLALLTALLITSLAPAAQSTLRLASMFADHLVLQRDQPVPVWGEARPGDEVTVEFAGQRKTAMADADGQWSLTLDPLAACAVGRELEVRSPATNAEAQAADVLVGDVWLCSGQSNMHFRMAQVEDAQGEIAAATHPAIRFFTVGHQFARTPSNSVQGAWAPVSPQTAGDCSAVAYYFARDLHQELGVPIGLLVSSVGGTRIESWMRPETLAKTGVSNALVEKWNGVSDDEFEEIGATYRAYQHQRDRVHPQLVRAARAAGTAPPAAPPMPRRRRHDCPSALHHGMIAPLEPFAIRGAVWYQGESNSRQAAAYEQLLPAMIADWRQVWGEDLPFLFVQLAPHQSIPPAFREAQLRIWQRTPHTAMVVTTDVGDATNIHPTRKRPVGQRLALAARALAYHETLESSGPLYQRMWIEKDRAVVSFTHTGAGLEAKDGALQGFTLAAADGKFVPARAEIKGSTVVVTSKKIPHPQAVRYGWSKLPNGNLFNREGLPAAPFRSDAPAE